MQRPIVSVYIAVSLDGFIARADGSLDWLQRVHTPDGDEYGYAAFMAGVDALVLGCDTYETVLGFEPWPFAGKAVVVLTHRPVQAAHGERAHAGALASLMRQLGEQGLRRVYLDDGGAIRQALAEGLVDELTLWWIPVLLGEGRRLVGPPVPESGRRLERARHYPSGLVQATYLRVAA